MHIDENKKFDKRNIERNIKNGVITQKDYETYLSKLPDVIDKLFNLEGFSVNSEEFESKKEGEIQPKKKAVRKKSKGKVK
ncbi:MAG: hypothetical protein ABSH06_00955 [Thermodesulfobacteriota bacterium]|jgi:hypothetical protein